MNFLLIYQINVNLEALFKSDNLELPHGMTLTRSRMNPMKQDQYVSLSYKVKAQSQYLLKHIAKIYRQSSVK